MVQSVATPQANARHEDLPSNGWENGVTGLRFALANAKQKFLSHTWFLQKPLSYDLSSSATVDRIAARLAVEDRARTEAGSEHPPSTEEMMRGTQGEIVHYFRHIQQQAHRQVDDAAEKMRRIGARVDSDTALQALRDIPSRTKNAVLRISTDAAAELELAREREDLQRRHYETFRKENKLDRVAIYPASPLVYYLVAFALAVLVVFALGRSDTVGIAATNPVTLSHAIPIALFAVVAPFVIGAGIFRSINHVDALGRFTGWAAGAMTMAFVGALAFFAAHYVTLLATNSDATLKDIVSTILSEPLRITAEFAAWRIFAIVGLSGFLAFLVGYRADDPYPEYGDVQRAYYAARSQHERLTERLRRRINKIVDAAEREVVKANSRLRTQAQRYVASVRKLERMQAQSHDFEVALEDTCSLVLDRYRTANRSVRMTEAPLSFAEHASFRSDDDPTAPLLHAAKTRLEEIDGGINEFEAELVKVRHELRDINWLAINELDGTEKTH